MATRYVKPSKKSAITFAPGDQVIRYVNGQPYFCTVVQVEQDEQVRVSCNLWPSGYSALVKPQDVALVSRSVMSVDF